MRQSGCQPIEFDILTGKRSESIDLGDSYTQKDGIPFHRLPLINEVLHPLNRGPPGGECGSVVAQGFKALHARKTIEKVPLSVRVAQPYLL